MTDPVTNMLAVQTQFGDEELRKQVDDHIREIAIDAIQTMIGRSHVIMQHMSVGNLYEFDQQVLRTIKNFYNNPRQIY